MHLFAHLHIVIRPQPPVAPRRSLRAHPDGRPPQCAYVPCQGALGALRVFVYVYSACRSGQTDGRGGPGHSRLASGGRCAGPRWPARKYHRPPLTTEVRASAEPGGAESGAVPADRRPSTPPRRRRCCRRYQRQSAAGVRRRRWWEGPRRCDAERRSHEEEGVAQGAGHEGWTVRCCGGRLQKRGRVRLPKAAKESSESTQAPSHPSRAPSHPRHKSRASSRQSGSGPSVNRSQSVLLETTGTEREHTACPT